MFGRVISNINARYKYGLTATPTRSDKMDKAMYAYIGMSPRGCFEPAHEIPASKVKKIEAIHEKFEIESGYNTEMMYKLYDASGMMNYVKLINELIDNSTRTDKIIANIKECHKQHRKQCVLSSRKSHCQEIVAKLNSEGVKAVLCTGDVKDKIRKDIIDQNIEWDVLVATYSLLKEGLTINALDTLHLVTPFKDGNLATQCVGRIEGYLENKNQPIAYDYVDVDIPYCIKRFDDRRRALKKRKK
jgi:superfamily II DNA or RNA helicase